LSFKRTFWSDQASAATGASGCRTWPSNQAASWRQFRRSRRSSGWWATRTSSIDLYAYGRAEEAFSTAFTLNNVPFGYGNLLYNNTACLHEAASVTAAATNCAANTKQVWQVTGGFWWDVYKGDFGRLRVGGQGSYTERRVFAGVGGELWPEVGDGMTG
jgi:hypothetical protein